MCIKCYRDPALNEDIETEISQDYQPEQDKDYYLDVIGRLYPDKLMEILDYQDYCSKYNIIPVDKKVVPTKLDLPKREYACEVALGIVVLYFLLICIIGNC
jgi:hypothetical protein